MIVKLSLRSGQPWAPGNRSTGGLCPYCGASERVLRSAAVVPTYPGPPSRAGTATRTAAGVAQIATETTGDPGGLRGG